MKRILSILLASVAMTLSASAQPLFGTYGHTLDFFMPKSFPDMVNGGEVQLSGKFNPAVPQPKDIIGFELGEFFVEWHAVLHYMYTLDRISDRVSIRTVETSHEKRQIIEVAITSPENQKNLEAIRAEHLKLSDASVSQTLDVSAMPVVISHICSMHGNEASGVNSSLAMAYFFAASEDETVRQILDNAVILITPGVNPDGINRYASWINSAASMGERLCDSNTREYSTHEPWPSSRVNHYWHDANRDLVMAQHPEGRASINIACDWMPNVIYDLHEYGGSKGFFFSPGDPKRLHPFVPVQGQEIARKFGKYTISVLNGLNEKYFTESGYDDFYLGKTGAYGDVQGIVSMLVEHENTRGFKMSAHSGKHIMDFPTATRNQAHIAITSVFAAMQNRELLHNFQRDFFLRSAQAASEAPAQGYVFSTKGDKGLEYIVLEWMKNHRFDVYRLAKDVKVKGVTYSADDSYIVPACQRYFFKFRGLWEDLTDYKSDRYYDVTTWAANRAFNVANAEVAEIDGLVGEKVTQLTFAQGGVSAVSELGYIVEADDLYSHNILRAMLLRNISVHVALKPFKAEGRTYACGTAYIPLEGQEASAEEIHAALSAAAHENGVQVQAVGKPLKLKETHTLTRLPRVAILTGKGMGTNETGEIWYMLDRRFGITPARIDINRVHKVKDLEKYDVIIAANGTSTLPTSEKAYPKLKSFVENGGVMIATGKAAGIVRRAKIAEIRLKDMPAKVPRPERNNGCIIGADVDNTHPLGYGYAKNAKLPVFKKGLNFFDEQGSIYDQAPLSGTAVPLISGYTVQKNLDLMASRPIVVTKKVGEGTLIYSSDNLTFRSYWFSTMKLFMNAIYFGNIK